jgi:site-specific recombinase XerD
MKPERLLGYYAKRFFAEYLSNQRSCSPNTIAAYRDALSLFLRDLRERKKVRPESATIGDVSAANVLAFLNAMQAVRGNCASTRNARLAAIRAFARYILLLEPTLSADLRSVLAIPAKRSHRRVLGYLTRAEVDAIVETPASSTWSGRRDRVLFLAMYNAGARVSEIVGVKGADVTLGASSSIRLHGKGRKERVLPLWKETATALRRWIDHNHIDGSGLVFTNARGQRLTRSGVAKRLAAAVSVATGACPSLKRQHISPHTFRHAIAMHLLQSGADITVVAMWLGHESIETTHIYVTSDMQMKEKGLAALQKPSLRNVRFRANDKLLSFLESI